MRIAIPAAQVQDPVAVAQLEQSILEKIREIPGVVSAGMTAFPSLAAPAPMTTTNAAAGVPR